MVQIIVSCLNFKNLPKYSTGICSKTIQQCSQKSQLEMEDPVYGSQSPSVNECHRVSLHESHVSVYNPEIVSK